MNLSPQYPPLPYPYKRLPQTLGVQPSDPGGVVAGEPYLEGERTAEKWTRRANTTWQVLPSLHRTVVQGGAFGADLPRDSSVEDERYGKQAGLGSKMSSVESNQAWGGRGGGKAEKKKKKGGEGRRT